MTGAGYYDFSSGTIGHLTAEVMAPRISGFFRKIFRLSIMRMPFLLICLAFLCSATSVSQSVPTVPTRASEVWKRTLIAKGGRQRLQKISNFLVAQRRPGQNRVPVYVDLHIVPDKYRLWSNDGDVLGTRIIVGDNNDQWMAYSYRDGRGVNQYPPTERRRRELWAQAMFLMERPWYDPKILNLKTERIGTEDFDVITVDAV